MTRGHKIIFILIFCSFFTQSIASNSYCQGERENKIIKAVLVKNNRAVSAETILSKIKTKVGDKFSQEILNEDLKRLYATEYFSDVSIDVEDYEDGLAVTFVVQEKTTIEDIVFEGNTTFRAQKLKSVIKSKPDEMLNLALLAQDIVEIKNLYMKKGYPIVDVKYELDVNKELNKAKIKISIDEKTRVKVARITITGNSSIKTKEIAKLLATKPAWLFNSGIFNDTVFQEDLDKIRALYDDKGFLNMEPEPKMEYSLDGKLLYITINIKEGKQYMVGDISIKGNIVLPEKDLRRNIKMQTGKPFSSNSLRADAVAIRQYYYRYGYMNAVIDVERNLNTQTGNIDVTYNIDARELVYVGKVEVRGNTKTKDIVIRRELRIYPGEKFDGDRIRRSKERLYNLGLFEDVNFDTEQTNTSTIQNLVVNVKEAKTGEFSFGGGYSSIDQLLGFVEVSQRNFDILNFPSFQGAGQNLVIKAEIGMVRNNYNISWTEPWIFNYPLSFGFDIYRASHRKELDLGWPYDETRAGGDVRLGKEITDYLRADAMYRLENVDIQSVVENASPDLKAEEASNWISSILFQLTQDTRDNIFNPTKGYIINGSIEDAGGIFLGDKDFIKGTGLASYYHTFFEKFVLEVKGRAGLATSYGDSKEVPIYQRFFAGGANTIRGYAERKVGPRDPGSNDPIGGEAILVGNVELTFPIYEKLLKGAVFCDAGNVWRRAEDFIVGAKYKSGAGVGLRIKTPIGPVSLDYGYPLVRNFDDDRTGEFYFSMSRGF